MLPIAMSAALVKAFHALPALFVQAVGPQLVHRWLPAGVDKAALDQVGLRREELQLRKAEIAAQSQRFQDQIAEARRLKFDELEKTRQLHLENDNRRMEYQRWPLDTVSPVAFLSASGARAGRALNLILAVIDTRDAAFYGKEQGKAISALLDMFHGEVAQSAHRASAEFCGDVALYYEVMKSAKCSNDGLRATLWNLLKTEPTVLIEVNLPTQASIAIHVSSWGYASEPNAPWVSQPSQHIDLPMLANLKTESEARAAADEFQTLLSAILASIVITLGDTHRALYRPHEAHVPVLPHFLKTRGRTLSQALLKPMFSTYSSTYESISVHSPLLASELSAAAAVEAYNSSQTEMAELLLAKSVSLNPVLKKSDLIDSKALQQLRRLRSKVREPLEVENALQLMRKLTVDAEPTPLPESKREKTLDDLYRAFGKRRSTDQTA